MSHASDEFIDCVCFASIPITYAPILLATKNNFSKCIKCKALTLALRFEIDWRRYFHKLGMKNRFHCIPVYCLFLGKRFNKPLPYHRFKLFFQLEAVPCNGIGNKSIQFAVWLGREISNTNSGRIIKSKA